jgi:gluconokinase
MDSSATSLVVMGVAGCGKSSLGAALAARLAWRLIEGDDFHSPQSKAKMASGIALDDADRAGWLGALGDQLRQRSASQVLTCSALKKSYRERLRHAAPGLRFVFLDISPSDALARVAARGSGHFFSPALIDSQFAALESPVGEPGVLRVDAMHAPDAQQASVLAWLPRPGTV